MILTQKQADQRPALIPHSVEAERLPADYTLQENLTARQGRIFLTGIQALVRMLLTQREADRAAGLNTAGFITGYRGSPLGGVDLAMWHAQHLLQAHDIRFLPAINEDLGATMVMGTQQAGTHTQRSVDGVFALWYGKGPGLDRSGDAVHHGNAAGASAQGGVLMVVGDDHTAASSSIPHASEASLIGWRIPIVNPASVEEYELFGRWGWALSRYSGAWVAFKAITETVESGRAFELRPIPDFSVPGDDPYRGATPYSAREFLTPEIELRMARRIEAVHTFARHHSLDRLARPAPHATLGIVSTGKAFLDVEDALDTWRARHPDVALPTLRHYKVGLSWPLEQEGLLAFAQDLKHILVVEEKGTVIESQIKDILYNTTHRPTVCGEYGLERAPLLPRTGQLNPDLVGDALARWLASVDPAMTAALAALQPVADMMPAAMKTEWAGRQRPMPVGLKPVRATPAAEPRDTPSALALAGANLTRRPYFCSGCPHSTSTRVPEGSQALAGVGCHYMATWMDRNTAGLTQMGGEGADWIGLSGYTRMPHVFQNMGEGTYFHSGYLAIRQAVAARARITYKILFNDAVAMTGGQPVDGPISVPGICQQLLGEGVKRVVITTDDTARYRHMALPAGVTVHPREALDELQRALREEDGVTILIHDQVCAAEKRRRRKKKTMAEPPRRLFINTAVCEGCGDCGTQSNCLSLVPVETPFGRKRAIDQSSCNKDYSCVKGFCPSFVSVIGGTPRHTARDLETDMTQLQAWAHALPEPARHARDRVCNVLIAGIGGTGVTTISAILAMAAHLEGCAVSLLDITGLAQKGGTVISHVRIGTGARAPGAVRIGAGQADVAILCDPVAACRPDALRALRPSGTQVALNTWLAPTAEFLHDPQAPQSPQGLIDTLRAVTGCGDDALLDAHTLATHLLGDAILANMMMLGHAWQRGALPVGRAALRRAITLNGTAVDANLKAFELGRLAAARPDALGQAAPVREQTIVVHRPESLATVTSRYAQALTAYQNAAYAHAYTAFVDQAQRAEQSIYPGARPRLALAVAHSLYKLMAYKDEYEVARLYTDGSFRRALAEAFEGDYTLRFHLAPPLLARRDPHTGHPRKITLGPATEAVFRLLARCKALRGTWFDPFGHTDERRLERQLIRDYQAAMQATLANLNQASYAEALDLASLPQGVRGFGHIKEGAARACLARLQAAAQAQGGAAGRAREHLRHA
ncbi:indolepyruvate ferredoxin oxidoreductase family protein [Pusillimonas sp. TS35]|uniref:indolepyruvate ferredoxin oxidoreductase family protein n=1 Tax=Paracandidimonas lactea TaxID=2895524 RepID=UPI001370F808|nr:indolepyruvate ferredoxin oxidoreductase family protein [Paracandidimonas lactea]MYN14101.1 indolepyruvate ferredoxin oxidoreductase family protein [Pusillimonas sp. TS35]